LTIPNHVRKQGGKQHTFDPAWRQAGSISHLFPYKYSLTAFA